VNPPKKILVIKFRNIGDVLLTSPLISSLKLGLPGVRVCVAVKSGTEALLQGHPHVNHLYVLPEKQPREGRLSFLFRTLNWVRKLRRERFDLAINATEGDRGILLGATCGAKKIWSYKKVVNEKKWRKILVSWYNQTPLGFNHTVMRDLSFASALGLEHLKSVTLPQDTKSQASVHALLRKNENDLNKLVHLHPVSRWDFKSWNARQVAKLVDMLFDIGFDSVLTSSPNPTEVERIDLIVSLCKKTKPTNLAGKTSLKETAEISRACSLFIGVDSAPMHMAAAVETPVIAIFGPTGAYNWGPWPNGYDIQEQSPYPKTNGIQTISQHTVIQKSWSCVPCGRSGCDGLKKSACLDTLSAEEVLNIARQHLLT
jgi:heptosyltransferase-3